MAKNWAELPKELLGRILNKLFVDNIESFKMVCSPWFSAVQEEADLSLLCPAPSPPWLTIPLASGSESEAAFSDLQEDEDNKKETKENKEMLSARFFNPTNSKVYFFQHEEMKRWLPVGKEAVCVGSSHGWLAFIDARCVIYLTNPFKKQPDIDDEYRSRRIQLPSIETLPCILGVEREYPSPSGGVIIDYICWDFNDNKTSTHPSIDLYEFFILKLVVSSAPDDDNDCTVMAIYGDYHEIAFCKLGDTSWTTLNKPTMVNGGEGGQFATVPAYADIYYSSNDQCFYAFRVSGSFDIWDLRTPSLPKCTHIDLPKITSCPPSLNSREKWLRSWCTLRKYLVNFLGDTLLVIKYVAEEITEDGQIYTTDDIDAPYLPYKTMRFDVYKLDWVKKQWVHNVRGLGKSDGVLFLGINNAMTFSACDFPSLRGNSIYFTDDMYDLRTNALERPYGGHDSGIFGLEDNNIHPCFYPANHFKRIFPPPVWIAPNPW